MFPQAENIWCFRTSSNLKKVNQYVTEKCFKIEHVPTILLLMKLNAYMTSVNQQDAYFSVPIAKHHSKYLCFMWPDCQCLCFGLRLAAFYFTKAMKPFCFHSCDMWAHYIDDSLYSRTFRRQLERNMARVKELLQSLGFKINLEKSSL